MDELRISHFFKATDGLNLHVSVYGAANGRTQLVCLPGLTRPARDFDTLARDIHSAQNRRVICVDYRGRGSSDWDPDWTHYAIPNEQADILTVLAQLGVERAHFLGLSRGGLHGILLGAARPDLVASLVLDDIGPVVETAGLAKIKDYVGRLPLLRNWDAALAHFKAGMGDKFTGLSEADWLTYAQNTLIQTPQRLRLSYDPQIARTLDAFDPAVPLPDLWVPFCAIQAPIFALRGENSDVLSAETLVEMAARHPRCQTHVVPGQGHAPMLLDGATLERIGAFINGAES
jgi:pimeloyl-ACP methyl ester carboxylesterase